MAAQFDCFRTKIKIKPIQTKIVPKQALLSFALSLKKRNVKLHIKKLFRNKIYVWVNPALLSQEKGNNYSDFDIPIKFDYFKSMIMIGISVV